MPIFALFRYQFWRIWSGEKSLVFGFGKLGLGFGEFGLGKKASVLENLVSKKGLGIGFGQNFGTVAQCGGGGAAKNNFKIRPTDIGCKHIAPRGQKVKTC